MSLPAFRPNTTLSRKAWGLVYGVSLALLVGVWSFGDRFSIPGPVDTLRALGELVRDDGLLYELGVSLRINVESIVLSTVISVGLAYLTVMPAFRPFVAFCTKARFFSMAGFVTVFTLAFGGGHWLKVSLLTFGMTVFFLTSMTAVVESIPRADWDQARSLRMSPWRMVLEVVVLGKAHEAFEVLRQNAAMGWMMLTMVEGLVRSEGGIGGVLLNTAKYRHFDAVFAVQFTVVVVGILQDRLLAGLKSWCCPYAARSLERQ